MLVQLKAVTAQKMIAPHAEAEEHVLDAASEATGLSSGGSIEVCLAIELVKSVAMWVTVGCAAYEVAVSGALAVLE